MKSLKLLLAGLVLCTSQAAFSATPEQDAAVASALEAVQSNPNSQAAVEAFITAAAAAGISGDAVVGQLVTLGITPMTIGLSVAHVGSSLPGNFVASLNTSLTVLGNTGSTGSGGGQGGGQGGRGGLASLGGGFSSGGLSGGPSGAVSPH